MSDEFPEHAKLWPPSRFQVTYDFFEYLITEGLVDCDLNQVCRLMRAWLGVDELAYAAEVAQLRVLYPGLWEQYGFPLGTPVEKIKMKLGETKTSTPDGIPDGAEEATCKSCGKPWRNRRHECEPVIAKKVEKMDAEGNGALAHLLAAIRGNK